LPRQPSESWQAVLTALRGGTARPLAEIVASPLGLWLLRAVHIEGRRGPKRLIEPSQYPDSATIQRYLLDELIPAVVHSRPPLPRGQNPLRPQHHHDPEQIRRWLTTLANELRDAQTRDWRWWQFVTAIPRSTHRASVGLTAGLAFGFAGVLGGSGIPGLAYRLAGGLTLGLVFGLTTALAPAVAADAVPGRRVPAGAATDRGAGVPVPSCRPAGPPRATSRIDAAGRDTIHTGRT
jgi:hypothetical protein